MSMQSVCTDFYGKEHLVETAKLIDRTSAYGIYIEDKKVLLIQDPSSLRWELPGGGIEQQETIREGLIREFLEETGVIPEGPFRLLREWTEYFFDTPSQQGWRAQRMFYTIEKMKSHKFLTAGNGIDTASAQMLSINSLANLDIMPRIRETVLLAHESRR